MQGTEARRCAGHAPGRRELDEARRHGKVLDVARRHGKVLDEARSDSPGMGCEACVQGMRSCAGQAHSNLEAKNADQAMEQKPYEELSARKAAELAITKPASPGMGCEACVPGHGM